MIAVSEDEVQAAHDALNIVCSGEVLIPMQDEEFAAFMGACDALGWILGCGCGENFKQALYNLLCKMKERGYELRRIDEEEQKQTAAKKGRKRK